MFLPDMKTVINYAMGLEILNLHTYRGYKGASILKITADERPQLEKLEEYVKNMGLEIKNDYDISTHQYILFIVFEHEDIYDLKPTWDKK